MSFDVEYDRDFQPIVKNVTPQEEPQKLQQPIQDTQENEQQEDQSVLQQVQELGTEEHEATEEQQEETVQEKPKSKPTPQESFSALRKKAERLERERDEALRILQQNQTQQKQPYQEPEKQQPEESEWNLREDEIAEGKHIHKMRRELKNLNEQLKQTQRIAYENQVEARIKSSYPDFDKIVTKDAIEHLRDSEPELIATLNTVPDLYNKAISTYKMIKKFGYEAPDYNQIEEKLMAHKNIKKPKTLNSISPQRGESPLAKANQFANGLTEDLKAQLWKEMQDAMRQG